MRAAIKIRRDGWPFNAAMQIEVPPGDDGVPHALAAMREIVIDAQADPNLHGLAATIKRLAESKNINVGAVLYDALTRWFKFERDPIGIELLRTPAQIMDNISKKGIHNGDCDELAIFACAILKALKMPCSFIVMSDRPGRRLHHVFYAIGSRALTPYDPQERITPGQWPRHHRILTYPV